MPDKLFIYNLLSWVKLIRGVYVNSLHDMFEVRHFEWLEIGGGMTAHNLTRKGEGVVVVFVVVLFVVVVVDGSAVVDLFAGKRERGSVSGALEFRRLCCVRPFVIITVIPIVIPVISIIIHIISIIISIVMQTGNTLSEVKLIDNPLLGRKGQFFNVKHDVVH